MTFVQRSIAVTFVLGEGDFGEAGQNTIEVSGLRASAKISNAGGRAMGTADLRVWGMTLSTMNRLSSLGMAVTLERKNSVTIKAGDEGGPMPIVFQGTINQAWAEFDGMPSVPFHVLAQTGLFNAVQPATPISIRGSANVAELLSSIATQMNLAFENNGVTARLPGGYYAGSPRGQAVAIVKDAGIEWNGGEKGLLAIWNPGQSRGGLVPEVSPQTGMIGYPTFTANGLMLRTLYNPSIGLGTKIKVVSSLKEPLTRALAQPGAVPRSELWVVYKIDHDLDAQVPGGQWSSTILCAPPGLGPFTS